MKYTPDYNYEDGQKRLAKLEGKNGKMIRYYVQKKDEHIQKLHDRIKAMQEVFDGIKRYAR